MKWEPSSVKSQLRRTSQRLGQVQAKNDSQANITRTDIKTLIQRNNVPLAREKAEKLIQDEAFGDLLEEIEMQIGVLLEHFHELEYGVSPSPIMVEAISTIIYAAPHVHSTDLDVIRSFLAQCLGPDFTRSAVGNRDNHVSQGALKALSMPIPSAYQLDSFLQDIADNYGLPWSPEPQRQDIVNTLSEFLDPEASPEVDLPHLRRLCMRGIPDEPVWLRPRIWKLFFGILPKTKMSWKAELVKQREAYYDLVKRLLAPFPHATMTSSPLDDKLLAAHKQLSGLPRDIFALLEDEPETFSQCPLNEEAPEEMRIPFAQALETRLKILQNTVEGDHHTSRTPEFRLEPQVEDTPGISLTSFDSEIPESSMVSTTLLPSRKCIFGNAHPKHCGVLLRLLYIHNTINAGNLSPHTASLLVPLYSALIQEVDADDLTHVEADTFWLLEAVVAEFSGLEDDEGNAWMKKFSERLAWADYDLFTDLEARGLDPALPHYSYRWLMPILTHTLPLPSLFLVWDAVFSCQARERGSNPKLDYLVDICISMLIRAKNHLLLLGKVGQSTRSLWTGEVDCTSQSVQSQDAFIETLSFLQTYDLRYVGGIERVLQTASEVVQRREQESLAAQQTTLSLGARFKVNMWRGFTHQRTSSDSSVSSQTDGNKQPSKDYSDSDTTETAGTSYQSSLASQISNTFWKGITNQSAMEDVPPTPPSPSPSASPEPSPRPIHRVLHEPVQNENKHQPVPVQGSSNIWGYADKLKDSDAVATLSKVGSNWRARGLLGSWGATLPSVPSFSSLPVGDEKVLPTRTGPNSLHERRGSLPFFDSPRLFPPPPPLLSDASRTHSEPSPQSTAGLMEKTKSLLSIARSPPPATPKSAPRPLLLNSSTPITSGQRKSSGHPRSASLLSTPDTDEWADVMREKRHHFHRDSQSSVSSLSPSDVFGRIPKSSRSDWESDTNPSRIISLNRRSVSPMAPNFYVAHARPSSGNSSTSSDFHSPPVLAKSPLQESSSIDGHGISPLNINKGKYVEAFSSPVNILPGNSSIAKEHDSDSTSNELHPPSRRPSWKTVVPSQESDDTAHSAPIGVPTRTVRVRSKRNPRPANLQIQDHQRPHASAEQKGSSPSNLTVEWPADDQENILTPKASTFDSDEHPSIAQGIVRSPRRLRKVSSGDPERPRKASTDTMTEDRPRKVSTGHRSRKISTESRDIPRSRRESAAEEGDDEGYDELLSAYESEDGPNGSSLP